MNKIILSMPKPLLIKYLENNFSKLSVNDFFEIIEIIDIPSHYFKNNKTLNENSNVLSRMLGIDKYAFRYFKPIALIKECVDKIARSNIELSLSDIENYPQLLENNSICENIIEKYPQVLKKMNDQQITGRIINILEEIDYILDEEDIKKHPIFLKRKNLLIKATQNNPDIIFKIEELRQLNFIMEPLIEKDPSLITTIRENCYIDYNLAVKTLKKYQITKEDLEKNPALTKNYSIMKLLPELKLYSAFLDDKEKKEAIFNHLKNNFTITKEELPFLDYKFGGKTDISKLSKLFEILSLQIDEFNIDEQKDYFQILDKIIDGIVNIRYTKNKLYFKYPDIVSLNDSIIELFNNSIKEKDYNLIKSYIEEMHAFIGESLPVEYIQNEINKYYKVFNKNGLIDLSLTNEFCNKMLNQHRNYFISKEKERILNKLMLKINLTEAKTTTILNSKKLEKIAFYIREQSFSQIGITIEEFNNSIESTKNFILNNKKIIKSGVIIDQTRLEKLIEYFKYNGVLNSNIVAKTLNIDNEEVSKLIANKFEQIKIKLLNNIELSSYEKRISNIEKIKIGKINYVNHLILERDRYLKNLSEILFELDDETLEKILENKELLNEVSYLLPLVNLIDEFDTKTFINILSSYERIRNKILSTININEEKNYKELMLKKISDIISLANAYRSVDDISLFALGENVVSEVGEHNASKYLAFYLKMISRESGNIPPISLQTEKYYLDSGLYSDTDRLIIGAILKGTSCIDLNNIAGGKTYNEVLLKDSADVVLIKNKQKKLISRILLFRKGNVIQMVSNMYDKHPLEIYKIIADRLIEESLLSGDNIDYIFVNTSSVNNIDENYQVIDDSRFITDFPHADFSATSILISSKSKVLGFEQEKINLDFDVKSEHKYIKRRKKISYSPTEIEITKLRALDIVMTTDPVEKENKSRNFELFYINEYKRVVCGEDWYIALKNDGTLEEIILPSNDSRTYDEMAQIKEELFLISNNKTL